MPAAGPGRSYYCCGRHFHRASRANRALHGFGVVSNRNANAGPSADCHALSCFFERAAPQFGVGRPGFSVSRLGAIGFCTVLRAPDAMASEPRKTPPGGSGHIEIPRSRTRRKSAGSDGFQALPPRLQTIGGKFFIVPKRSWGKRRYAHPTISSLHRKLFHSKHNLRHVEHCPRAKLLRRRPCLSDRPNLPTRPKAPAAKKTSLSDYRLARFASRLANDTL